MTLLMPPQPYAHDAAEDNVAVRAPRVAIVLVNYRNADDTLTCLQSLQRLDYPIWQAIVVDNASNDNSVTRLKESELRFHLIESAENLGFSGGNNLGIRVALEQGADYIWILNNDTQVASDALQALVQTAERTGGLVGSLLLNEDGSYQRAGTTLNRWTGRCKDVSEAKLDHGMHLDCLCFASVLIPRRVFELVGLMDERYFLYFEDAEFSLRARKAGFPTQLCMESRVYHAEGATTGKNSLRTRYYYHRNRLLLLSEYGSHLQHGTVAAYSFYRLLRTALKALTKQTYRPELRVEWLALCDVLRGKFGPCRHSL